MTCLPNNLPNDLPNGSSRRSQNCLPTRTGVLWLLPLLLLTMLTTPMRSQAQAQTQTQAQAQTPAWPSKAMRLIVPFPPGGPTDFIGRAAGSILSEALGQPVLIENRAGANGTIGLETLAKSAPDGYTVGLTAITLATAPHLGKVPFDEIGRAHV